MTKKLMEWVIKDWAGNTCFNGQSFSDFGDAEDFLCIELGDDYDSDRQEYTIQERKAWYGSLVSVS